MTDILITTSPQSAELMKLLRVELPRVVIHLEKEVGFNPPRNTTIEGSVEMSTMNRIKLGAMMAHALLAGSHMANRMSEGWARMVDSHNPNQKRERATGRRSNGVHYITHTKVPGPTRAVAKRLKAKAKGKATAKARGCYKSAKK